MCILFLLRMTDGHFLVVSLAVLSLCRVYAAVVFTALSVGRTSSFAPDLTKARVSASRILALIRREPPIDSYSKDGLRLVRAVMKPRLLCSQCPPAHAYHKFNSRHLRFGTVDCVHIG